MEKKLLEKHGEPGGARSSDSHRKHVTYRKYELHGSLELRDLRQFHETQNVNSTWHPAASPAPVAEEVRG